MFVFRRRGDPCVARLAVALGVALGAPVAIRSLVVLLGLALVWSGAVVLVRRLRRSRLPRIEVLPALDPEPPPETISVSAWRPRAHPEPGDERARDVEAEDAADVSRMHGRRRGLTAGSPVRPSASESAYGLKAALLADRALGPARRARGVRLLLHPLDFALRSLAVVQPDGCRRRGLREAGQPLRQQHQSHRRARNAAAQPRTQRSPARHDHVLVDVIRGFRGSRPRDGSHWRSARRR